MYFTKCFNQILSIQKNIARWKERSTGSHSDAEYKQLLNTLEREKGKMTTALDQLKSMKSDKSCLEELVTIFFFLIQIL